MNQLYEYAPKEAPPEEDMIVLCRGKVSDC
jgi:hypothetical protein